MLKPLTILRQFQRSNSPADNKKATEENDDLPF